MIRFRSPLQPAHCVRLDELTFKFVGGRLAVSDADAELVRSYARAHPELRIEKEIVGPEIVVPPAAGPALSVRPRRRRRQKPEAPS